MNETPKELRNTNHQRLRLSLKNRFPAYTQRFWTWLTGIALPDQIPLFIWRPWTRALALFAQLYIATLLGTILLNDLTVGGELWT